MKATVQTAENTASANAKQVLTLLGSAGSTGSPIFNAWQQAGAVRPATQRFRRSMSR
jgi:hypothetical protein